MIFLLKIQKTDISSTSMTTESLNKLRSRSTLPKLHSTLQARGSMIISLYQNLVLKVRGSCILVSMTK